MGLKSRYRDEIPASEKIKINGEPADTVELNPDVVLATQKMAEADVASERLRTPAICKSSTLTSVSAESSMIDPIGKSTFRAPELAVRPPALLCVPGSSPPFVSPLGPSERHIVAGGRFH